jgi:hypothetical protein
LREQPGTVAVVERSQLPLIVYLGAPRVVVVPEDTTAPAEYLRQHPADYVVETQAQPFFAQLIAQSGSDVTLVEEFTTPSAPTVARLYHITLP